jgi:hypothetical protein
MTYNAYLAFALEYFGTFGVAMIDIICTEMVHEN